jgi:hypothetical protein
MFVLYYIYLKLGPASYMDIDMLSMFLLLIGFPIFLIACTIAICFLVGMPIRVVPKVYNWWYNRPYISLLLLSTGFYFCYLSYQPRFLEPKIIFENGENITVQTANFIILTIGWSFTAFALTHLYFSSIPKWLKRKFN